jgi:hypothetical protein
VNCDFIVTSVFFLILSTDTFLTRKKARKNEESVCSASASASTFYVSENDAMNISVSNDTTVTLPNQRQTKCVIANTKTIFKFRVHFDWRGRQSQTAMPCVWGNFVESINGSKQIKETFRTKS